MEAEAFIAAIRAYIETAGLDVIPPLPKEAVSAIAGAGRQPRLVED